MYSKKQRIAAIAGVVLLVLLYVATLICAIFDFDGASKMFIGCLFASICVPILLWIYIGLYGKIANKKTIADLYPEVEGLEEAMNAKEETEAKEAEEK